MQIIKAQRTVPTDIVHTAGEALSNTLKSLAGLDRALGSILFDVVRD